LISTEIITYYFYWTYSCETFFAELWKWVHFFWGL